MAAYARSVASGSSGTTYSTATYTSSRGSVLSYDLAGELDLDSQLPRIDLSLSRWVEDEEEKAKKLERAKDLLDEFGHGGGDIFALERGLSEMGVGWVLDLADDASAGTRLLRSHRNLAERWIRALTEIMEFIHPCTHVYNFESVLLNEPDVPDPVQVVRFVEATVLKMLPFVDALLAAADLDVSNGAQAPSEKLQSLLDVREALFRASEGIKLLDWKSSVKMEAKQRISDELLGLLSAKEHRLDEAIWNKMEEVRTRILAPTNDDHDTEWVFKTPQVSSDISKVTRFLINYIKSLWNNYNLLNHIVRTSSELGNYVPDRDISRFIFSEQDTTVPLTRLTLEMVSSLEEKLVKGSESFPDHSLRFLFLVNNTHFIQQHLRPLFGMEFHMAVLTPKIDDYIQEYLQVSWAPVLSCLHNHTPHCFGTKSALPKFDSEFQKTYTAQKLWKVPDPELRKGLRKAIIELVVSALTKYLDDNNVTNPGVTPQELEKMLLELFEG